MRDRILAAKELNAMVVCANRHEAMSLGRALRNSLPSLNIAICGSSGECISLLEAEGARYSLLVAATDPEGCEEICRWAQGRPEAPRFVYLSSPLPRSAARVPPGQAASEAVKLVERAPDNSHLDELSRLALELLAPLAPPKPLV
jgi:hypothetical protein